MIGRLPRLLTAALAAADRGWPVFPVVPYGKRPAIRGWPQHATCDPDRLAAWWGHAPYNIGLACGPAGLLVVDLDQPQELASPPLGWAAEQVRDGRDVLAVLARRAGQPDPCGTYTVATPRGEHRYYEAGDPARTTTGTLGWLVDTRAAGGYVLAAGSVRTIGNHRRYYRPIPGTGEPAPAPQWLLDALAPPQLRTTTQRSGRVDAYVAAVVRAEVEQVRTALPGTRNSTLFLAAFRLGQLSAAGLIGAGEVIAVLNRAGSRHIGTGGFTAVEARTAIDNGLRYGHRRPRHLRSSHRPVLDD